jgi:hypothetical protein
VLVPIGWGRRPVITRNRYSTDGIQYRQKYILSWIVYNFLYSAFEYLKFLTSMLYPGKFKMSFAHLLIFYVLEFVQCYHLSFMYLNLYNKSLYVMTCF